RGRRGNGQDWRGHAALAEGNRRRRARDDADRLPDPEPAVPDSVSGRRLGLPAALLLAGAALLAHANGVPGGFTYDDKGIVRDNPRIRSPASVPSLFSTQYFGGPPGSGTAYRPVLLLSFAVQWWIHGGNATAYRAVNVLLHLAATLLLGR